MQKYGKWVSLGACLLWCAVIFRFSLSSGSDSAVTSGRVLMFCNSLFEGLHLPLRLTAVAVRKLAHFTEFFVLGALLLPTLMLHGFGHPLLVAAPCALLVAAVDESIQAFVPGRAPSVLDVLLDLSGALCGSLAFLALCLLLLYIKKKRLQKSKKTT